MKNDGVVVRKLHVPIYDVNVFIIVADDLYKERRRKMWTNLFGDLDCGDYCALCARGPKGFALFFKKDFIITKIVLHEIFHLTHRIMERTGEPFDSTKHEQGAALHEFLTDRINGILNTMTVKPDRDKQTKRKARK